MSDKSPKGIYVLLIELPKDRAIKVGGLGKIFFPQGFYAYVGSAMNGLNQRISRHLRKDKAIHWHVDYLLKKAQVKDVTVYKTEEQLECALAKLLTLEFNSIPGFGASDCKCESHLFFGSHFEKMKSGVIEAFESIRA